MLDILIDLVAFVLVNFQTENRSYLLESVITRGKYRNTRS
jgi:hypothetical protein